MRWTAALLHLALVLALAFGLVAPMASHARGMEATGAHAAHHGPADAAPIAGMDDSCRQHCLGLSVPPAAVAPAVPGAALRRVIALAPMALPRGRAPPPEGPPPRL